MKSKIAVTALNNAVAAAEPSPAACPWHSDRVSQFRSRKVQRALTRHAMVGSMGQVGSAGDNATMESFFSLLQNNVLDRRTWTTAMTYESRSSPGSTAPTTGAAAKPASAA